jgi:hypothetical protein
MIKTDPGARISFTHVWGIPGTSNYDTYFLHSAGLWYDAASPADKWTLFDENGNFAMDTTLAFNVLWPTVNGVGFTHTVTSANSSNNWSLIDDPALNNNPNAIFFITKVLNDVVYDSAHVGIWYSTFDGKWSVYNEYSSNALQLASKYNIFVPNGGTTCFKQVSTENDYFTVIDNPLLNGKPNMKIFIVHDYTNTSGNEHYVNTETGVWYNGSNWTIYTENISTLAVGTTFNVLAISDAPNGIVNYERTDQTLKVFPNPAKDVVNVALDQLTQRKIYHLSVSASNGKTMIEKSWSEGMTGLIKLDVSDLSAGLYILSAQTSDGPMVTKLNVVK